MKKVLCGLVIALMMTGNGYAKGLSKEKCNFLKDKAENYVILAWGNEANSKEPFYSTIKEENKRRQILSDTVLNQIKKAHYYAVTWSALCD